MVSLFAREMKQLSLAANVVSPELLTDIGNVFGRYFTDSLRVGDYEVRINAPVGTDGKRYLWTLWSSRDEKFTMPLQNDDGTIRGHTSYAVVNGKPLWILCRARGALDKAKTFDDQWSNVQDLPPYRGWPDACYFTEIVVPIGKPAIGYLILEFREALDSNDIAKQELQQVAGTIANFCGLCENYQRQITNTRSAVQNVNYRIRQSPLLKPKLFFAFSKRADAEVVGTAKGILGEFSENISTVFWDELQDAGNVNAQITNNVELSAYALCYLSEPSGEPGRYTDNPNVVFEAGMFHALTSDQQGQTNWIPIREESGAPAPFDFAHERMLMVPRNPDGTLNTQKFQSELRKRLKILL